MKSNVTKQFGNCAGLTKSAVHTVTVNISSNVVGIAPKQHGVATNAKGAKNALMI
jgi:hypothetical protein